MLRRFSLLDMTDIEPEELRPLRAALRALDPVGMAELLAERRRLGWEDKTLDQSELWCALTPRAVWQYRQNGAPAGWVVYERVFVPHPHPGASDVGLTYFDRHGEVQARMASTTGWRRYLAEARLLPIPGFAGPVVVPRTVGFAGQRPERQVYTAVGGRFDLVRLEGEDGEAVRNPYLYVHVRVGPVLWQLAEQWEADLRSGDRGRVVRALVWLSGYHLGPLRPGEERRHDMKPQADAELPRAVRARPGVVARLRQLADGGEPWEREAALMVLDPGDAR